MRNHTPGPWHAWQSGSEWIVSSKHEDHPPWMHDQFGGTHNVAATIARPANAQLIAAAPELLEACKALIDADHHDHFAARMSDSEMAAIERIKAAIAKAEAHSEAPHA